MHPAGVPSRGVVLVDDPVGEVWRARDHAYVQPEVSQREGNRLWDSSGLRREPLGDEEDTHGDTVPANQARPSPLT